MTVRFKTWLVDMMVIMEVVAAILLIAVTGTAAAGSIVDTKHNLSVSGPGDLVAVDEQRVCIFCHTPHHASPVTPLWSRETGGTAYNLYASTTLHAQPGQPTGASRLCLSCHDGTIALGMLYQRSEPISFVGGVGVIPASRSTNLQTDLSDDHPVSFPYTSTLAAENGQLRDPASLPSAVKLEDEQLLQCTSCHNPHKNPYGKFLVMDNDGSALCLSCHQPTAWSRSSHAQAASMAAKACDNCHLPHNAPAGPRLLLHHEEEQTCFSCHDGSGSSLNVQADFNKFYRHPVAATTGVHDPAENPLSAPEHVECVDCHNPHRVNGQTASAPGVNGRLEGVPGVDINGIVVASSRDEYQICFRCHADNSFSATVVVPRQVEEVNERLRFDPANPSYHPVAAIGKNANVPSLRPEYDPTSRIYCSDCHNSDQGSKAGGAGPDGVHGSNHPHLLLARYEQDNYPLSYAESNYSLCFRCHDPAILFDRFQSAFPGHWQHVQRFGISCSLCHDPHGVPIAGGATSSANAHLINFDTRFFTGSYDAVARSCTVSCHRMHGGTHGY